MFKLNRNARLQCLLVALVLLVTATSVAGQRNARAKNRAVAPAPEKAAGATDAAAEGPVIGKKVHLADGSSIQADEVWKSGGDFWYRIGSLTQRVGRPVKSIEIVRAVVEKSAQDSAASTPDQGKPAQPDAFWVMLKGGARLKVDGVEENEEGAWCRRGNFSVLIARERIDRIERESEVMTQPGWKARDWTTGNATIDRLIRSNGNRFGIDPYLVFCVIEHESHFRTKAVSPKGAQGLMQLMPGTAARFGVRNPFDPAQNIYGGTQYLKELLNMFRGRVDLALASYNAGEGAVLKYGGKVPPYRETREYVKRISNRYGVDSTRVDERRSRQPRTESQ